MKEGGGGGEGRKRFLPFFPTPSPLTRAIFRAAFAPKQHGHACYAGYYSSCFQTYPVCGSIVRVL